jgi:hypothetical protein
MGVKSVFFFNFTVLQKYAIPRRYGIRRLRRPAGKSSQSQGSAGSPRKSGVFQEDGCIQFAEARTKLRCRRRKALDKQRQEDPLG